MTDVFVYTAPSGKTKSRVKTVEKARIITSEEVRRKVIEAQKCKREGKEDKKTGGKKKSTSKSKSASMVASKTLKKVSKKAAKSAFKKMIQGQSDDEDSDSEPEFYHAKRRRTVHLSHTEESSHEDDIGNAETTVVVESTIDEPAVPHDINFTIDETTHRC